jgi:hypothetical protein
MTNFPWVFIAKANICLTEVQMNASTSSSLRADSHWNCCMLWTHVWLRIKILEVTQVCKISQQLTRRGYCEMLPNGEDAMSDVYSCFEVCNSAWMGLWTGQAKMRFNRLCQKPKWRTTKRQVWDPSQVRNWSHICPKLWTTHAMVEVCWEMAYLHIYIYT